jgi:hypothetical protein
MPSQNEYDDYYSHPMDEFDYDSDYTNQENYEDDYDEEGTYDEAYEDPEDLIYKDEDQVKTQWTFLTIGETKLRVFNTGAIQYPDSIFNVTYGDQVLGTSYRSVRVKVSKNTYKNFYIHDIVWAAFYGDLPSGWDIGHVDRSTSFDSNYCYSNHLNNLDIYMNCVSEYIHPGN